MSKQLNRPHPWTILQFGFRPFFLLSALSAILFLAMWLVMLNGLSWRGGPDLPLLWHAHEMLFGVVGAAMAGFLLTAVPNWTGRDPIRGRLLGIFVSTWIVGRLAMGVSGALVPGLTGLLVSLFPIMFAVLIGREIIANRNQRNYVIVAILTAFAACEAVFQFALTTANADLAARVLTFTLHLVLMLVTLIGGRVTPAFSANRLRAQGVSRLPVFTPWAEQTVLPLLLLVAAADTVWPSYWFTGVLALAAGVIHGVRLAGWRGASALHEPLVGVLHLAYAWLVVGYLLLGLSALTDLLPRSAALHALTIGGVATMLLAVMSRAALGHTGRKLRAPLPLVPAYLLLSVAALARLAAPASGALYPELIALSGGLWVIAFGIFCWVFWPILTKPRMSST